MAVFYLAIIPKTIQIKNVKEFTTEKVIAQLN